MKNKKVTTMIDLNEFYKDYCRNPKATKMELVCSGLKAVYETGYDKALLGEIGDNWSYAELLTEVLGWPDFNDSGLFEDLATEIIRLVQGLYKIGY